MKSYYRSALNAISHLYKVSKNNKSKFYDDNNHKAHAAKIATFDTAHPAIYILYTYIRESWFESESPNERFIAHTGGAQSIIRRCSKCGARARNAFFSFRLSSSAFDWGTGESGRPLGSDFDFHSRLCV